MKDFCQITTNMDCRYLSRNPAYLQFFCLSIEVRKIGNFEGLSVCKMDTWTDL